MDERYLRYKRALTGESLPLLFLDLDQLEANAGALSRMAGAKPVRIATKSIRCPGVLRHVLSGFPRFRGLMAYAAAEAAFLADAGFDDILIGYPSVETGHLRAAAERVRAGKLITFMVSEQPHVDALSAVAKELQVTLRICIDVDHSLDLPGLFFGVRRSRLRTAEAALALARSAQTAGNLQVAGLMGYEAQVAGVADADPVPVLRAAIIRLLKRISLRRIHRLRAQLSQSFRAAGIQIDIFNGAGTGSLGAGSTDPFLTEVTAGSGLFAPTLFDGYRDFKLKPALAFALRVARTPAPGWVTCSSGGFVASGSAGREKLPTPWLPGGLKLSPLEGAGEVQTPLTGAVQDLQIGDPVFFRHAKAGEVCEHFNEVVLIRGDAVVGRLPTYRGDGQRF
jgi:D-serine deaminase-like pyridoxal phosphate-dependent protein